MPVESLEFVIRIDEKTELSQRDFRMTSRPSTVDVPGGGKQVICQLSHEKPDLKVKLVYELLGDDFYTRKWLEIALPPQPHLINTIDVERLRIEDAALFLAGPDPKNQDWLQKHALTVRLGQPVFADNFFLGVEYPAAENSIDPAGWIALRQYIGRKMGAADDGEQEGGDRRRARHAVESRRRLVPEVHRPDPSGPRASIHPVGELVDNQAAHGSEGAADDRQSQGGVPRQGDSVECVPVSRALANQHVGIEPSSLSTRYGADQEATARDRLADGLMDGALGGGLSVESQGYETTDTGVPCFAAPKWGAYIEDQLLRHVKDWGLVCWKNDYTLYTCEKTDHGHLGGLYSVSAHADAMIDILQETRRIKPDFYAYDGFWLSPWWLMYVHTIWPDLTDFYVEYEFPGSNARDNQITSRDAHIYRRIMTDKFQVPLHSMMTCEPIRAVPPEVFRKMKGPEAPPSDSPPFVGDEDPLDRWTNNIVMHYCRGTTLTELYVSPWLLGDGFGDRLRNVMKWGIEHTDVSGSRHADDPGRPSAVAGLWIRSFSAGPAPGNRRPAESGVRPANGFGRAG